MVDADTVVLPAARRHLIRRPRLTKLLDESGARVILLVAPAGFGKTTLAQQWMEDKPHAWYRGTPASADVAALAAGIAEAAAKLVPGCDTRIRERLAITRDPEAEAKVLADLVAEDLVGWPSDGWFVFDDYQYATDSAASESFVETLFERTGCKLLSTSRSRARWASARGVAYGEILVVDRDDLALTPSETTLILGGTYQDPAEVHARCSGWPAVVGLAAIHPRNEVTASALPRPIHEFIAEELYLRFDAATANSLCDIAALPSFDRELLRELVGARADRLLVEGTQAGVLTEEGPERWVLHPLFAAFLFELFMRRPRARRIGVLTRTTQALIGRGRWDDAFVLALAAGPDGVLVDLIRAAVEPLLRLGRSATLEKWMERVGEEARRDPFIVAVRAELAFRRGDYARAEALARQAGDAIPRGHSAKARAYLVGGRSAVLGGRETRALRFHQQAQAVATNDEEERDALLGQFFAALDLEAPNVEQALDRINAIETPTPESILQVAAAGLVYSSRQGGVAEALSSARSLLSVLSDARDPVAASAFLHTYAALCAYHAHYDEALERVGDLLDMADRYRLGFILPHALHTKSVALIGIRRFRDGLRTLERAHRIARRAGDRYCIANCATLGARIAALGRLDRRATTEFPFVGLTSALRGEYYASQALLAASEGDSSLALLLQDRARSTSSSVETETVVRCVSAAIADPSDQVEFAARAKEAFEYAWSHGYLDAFVCTIRAFPSVLTGVDWSLDARAALTNLLSWSHDTALARRCKLETVVAIPGVAALSPREREVAELIVRGCSNKEIASALFISVPTAKVHVRSILRKLAVRSRTQAAIKLAAYGPSETESETG